MAREMFQARVDELNVYLEKLTREHTAVTGRLHEAKHILQLLDEIEKRAETDSCDEMVDEITKNTV